MKKLNCFIRVTLTFLVISPLFAFVQQTAQTQSEQKTKMEVFQIQTGTVVIKGYTVIGHLVGMGSVEIDAMELKDPTTGKKQMGVLIEIKESGQLENTDRSFIDYDEVDALLRGLDYIAKVNSEVTQLGLFEATYKTKGNFSASTYNHGTKIEVVVKSGYIRPASAYLTLGQLAFLRGYIVEAKQKLDSIK